MRSNRRQIPPTTRKKFQKIADVVISVTGTNPKHARATTKILPIHTKTLPERTETNLNTPEHINYYISNICIFKVFQA